MFLTLVLVPIMYMWLAPERLSATEQTTPSAGLKPAGAAYRVVNEPKFAVTVVKQIRCAMLMFCPVTVYVVPDFNVGTGNVTTPLGGRFCGGLPPADTPADPSFGVRDTPQFTTAASPYASVIEPTVGETPLAPGAGETSFACESATVLLGHPKSGGGVCVTVPPPEQPASASTASETTRTHRVMPGG